MRIGVGVAGCWALTASVTRAGFLCGAAAMVTGATAEDPFSGRAAARLEALSPKVLVRSSSCGAVKHRILPIEGVRYSPIQSLVLVCNVTCKVPSAGLSDIRIFTRGFHRSMSSLPRLRRRNRSRGQGLVEFALILPVFMLFLLIAVDFGRMLFTYIQLNNSAREAALTRHSTRTRRPTRILATRGARETNVQNQRGEGAMTATFSCVDSFGAPLACTAAQGGDRIWKPDHGQRERDVHVLHAIDRKLLVWRPSYRRICHCGCR